MHRRLVLFTLAVLALGAIPFVSLAEAKQPKCLIVNLGGGGGAWDTLQAAQDAAAAGDTLKVKGTCHGPTTLSKDLTVVGQSNPGFGTATLDGDQAGSVVTDRPRSQRRDQRPHDHGRRSPRKAAASSTARTLGDGGAVGGSVTLTDSIVTGNTATSLGGGIASGILTPPGES